MGSHQNKVDGKGRVSIPAPFRAALRRYAGAREEDAPCRMVLRPSHLLSCVEAWPELLFDRLAEDLDRRPLFSEEYDDLAATIFSEVVAVETDREGRIVLPESLASHAHIDGVVQFVGFGRHFRLWHPPAWDAQRSENLARARSNGLTAMLNGLEAPPRNGAVP